MPDKWSIIRHFGAYFNPLWPLGHAGCRDPVCGGSPRWYSGVRQLCWQGPQRHGKLDLMCHWTGHWRIFCVKIGAVRAQDGSRPVWSNVEQQHAGLTDGCLSLPNDQDPAAVEREALHGLCQQSEGGGQASSSRGALNISQVVPSQFFKIEDHITTTTILAIL